MRRRQPTTWQKAPKTVILCRESTSCYGRQKILRHIGTKEPRKVPDAINLGKKAPGGRASKQLFCNPVLTRPCTCGGGHIYIAQMHTFVLGAFIPSHLQCTGTAGLQKGRPPQPRRGRKPLRAHEPTAWLEIHGRFVNFAAYIQRANCSLGADQMD